MDSTTIIELCRRELVLCGVTEGQRVVVLSQGSDQDHSADAFMRAAAGLGASTFHMKVAEPQSDSGDWVVGQSGVSGNSAAVEAMCAADLVVDLIFLLFSDEQFAIQKAGTRIISAVEPWPLLARLFPTKELRERVEVGVELMEGASSLRITSDLGTDVTYQMGAYPTLGEYGYTDTPGRWDHWPSGFVFSGGADDGVDGQIVLAPGDVLLPFNTYVQSPVTLTIETGFITDIRGDLDADLLSSYIKSFNDPRGYGMSHVGWGLDERARWHGLTQFGGGMGMELRSFFGNVMFSIGPNNELGGPNDTACHFDIPMRGCSLTLDDQLIVENGDVVIPEMRPAGMSGRSHHALSDGAKK